MAQKNTNEGKRVTRVYIESRDASLSGCNIVGSDIELNSADFKVRLSRRIEKVKTVRLHEITYTNTMSPFYKDNHSLGISFLDVNEDPEYITFPIPEDTIFKYGPLGNDDPDGFEVIIGDQIVGPILDSYLAGLYVSFTAEPLSSGQIRYILTVDKAQWSILIGAATVSDTNLVLPTLYDLETWGFQTTQSIASDPPNYEVPTTYVDTTASDYIFTWVSGTHPQMLPAYNMYLGLGIHTSPIWSKNEKDNRAQVFEKLPIPNYGQTVTMRGGVFSDHYVGGSLDRLDVHLRYSDGEIVKMGTHPLSFVLLITHDR